MRGLSLGIDISGSSITAAYVDVASGALRTDVVRSPTPRRSTPAAVAAIVAEVCERLRAGARELTPSACGVALPAIVRGGVTTSVADLDIGWRDHEAERSLSEAIGSHAVPLNDADAVGWAESAFGAARGVEGTVLVLLIRAGVGSALFVDGTLVPNTELGQLAVRGHEPVEDWLSDRARRVEGLSWERWVGRLNAYLEHLTALFGPERIVLAGSVTESFDEKIAPRLRLHTPVFPAAVQPEPAVVGAAWLAARARSL
jgi:polyphosphate glucokinase